MADVPKEYLESAAPFAVTAIDQFGTMEVRGDGGHYPKTYKVLGQLYTCLSTKAVDIWVAPGYDAKSFLDAHTRHTLIYEAPVIAISDHGSQIVAASREVKE